MRGTAGGINLVRNQMVMDDQDGELIGKFIQNPHAKGQAPKMDLTSAQVHDLTIYMHTFMNYRTIVMPPDINAAILAVGDAKAGEAYFNAHCTSCHSVTVTCGVSAPNIPSRGRCRTRSSPAVALAADVVDAVVVLPEATPRHRGAPLRPPLPCRTGRR